MKNKAYLFSLFLVCLCGLILSAPGCSLIQPPVPTSTTTPTWTPSPTATLTPTITPSPTATKVPIPPSGFSASFQFLTADDQDSEPITQRVEKTLQQALILHSIDEMGILTVKWQDDDPLDEATVLVDGTLLGDFPVQTSDEEGKYSIVIGTEEAPFSMEGLETRTLTLLAEGVDGAVYEYSVTLTRSIYNRITDRLETVPKTVQSLSLGYNELCGGSCPIGPFVDFVASREFLWDAVEIRADNEEFWSWRDHLGEPSRLVQAFVEERQISILFPGGNFSVSNPYYTQFRTVEGFTVQAGRGIDPLALDNAVEAIEFMFIHRPDVLAQMAEIGGVHAIYVLEAGPGSLPEYDYIPTVYPMFANARGIAGGLAPTGFSASNDEDALNLSPAFVVIHEVAHSVHIEVFSESERAQLDRVFEAALENPSLAQGHYALTDSYEFWAQATEAWFGEKFSMVAPSIMKVILPELYELLERYWGPPK